MSITSAADDKFCDILPTCLLPTYIVYGHGSYFFCDLDEGFAIISFHLNVLSLLPTGKIQDV